MSNRIKVSRFEIYDMKEDTFRSPPYKATDKAIMMAAGVSIPGTEENVDPCELDSDGRHVGPPHTPR